MTFATIKDTALYPIVATPLNSFSIAGADAGKKSIVWVYDTSGYITLQTYESYNAPAAAEWSGSCAVNGWWPVN